MIAKSKRIWMYLASCLVAALIAVATPGWLAHARQKEHARQEMGAMLKDMKTVCVGRLLIDLPGSAEYHLQGAFLDGFSIAVEPETEHDFSERVRAREEKLAHPGPYASDRLKPLERSQAIRVGNFAGKLLIAERQDHYWFEGDKRVESQSVRIEAHAYAENFSVSIMADLADPEMIEIPLKILAQLQLNPNNHIPAEPGFCIDHAFLREPLTADQQERVTMHAGEIAP